MISRNNVAKVHVKDEDQSMHYMYMIHSKFIDLIYYTIH